MNKTFSKYYIISPLEFRFDYIVLTYCFLDIICLPMQSKSNRTGYHNIQHYHPIPSGTRLVAQGCVLMKDPIQFLDKTDCISHNTNTLGKGMNPIILPPAMGK